VLRHFFFSSLSNPKLYQLPHQAGRQWLVRWKPDRALASVVTLEFLCKRFQRGARIKRAVIRGRPVGHKQLSVKTESRQLIADTLLGFWRSGLDGLPKRFERGSLIGTHRSEISVVGLGFVCLGWSRSVLSAGLFSSHLAPVSSVVHSSDLFQFRNRRRPIT
jgi:hypothetical protein